VKRLAWHREEYEALVGDLAAEGFDAELEPPVDERSGSANLPPEALFHLVIYVGTGAGAAVNVARLVSMVQRRLRQQREGGRERRGVIYLENGETHEFPLDEDG